jgi:hypothetical protein
MKVYRTVKVKLHSNYFIQYYGLVIYIRDFYHNNGVKWTGNYAIIIW